jgi:hypothetical protein
MFAKRPLPLAGIGLALLAGTVMLASGSNAWLTLGVVVLWVGSLWLNSPEPQVFDARVDAREVSRDAIHEVIEPVGLPLLLHRAAPSRGGSAGRHGRWCQRQRSGLYRSAQPVAADPAQPFR